jgi:signal recognition particle subunit SRP54
MILDTAGRSQLDEALMNELRAIVKRVPTTEILLVVDAMIGQEALHIAEGFRDAVPLSGLVMTKMEGDARGGAAISIRAVTGVPLKYLGTGEGLDALESYDPARLAARILGMGDVIGLIERAESALDQKEAQAQAEKMMSGQFNLEDFSAQLKQLRKMGPLSQLLEMLPGGMGQLAKQISPQEAEGQLKLTEAIINSMTREERRHPDILNASRRRRIASGSGTDVQVVNRMMKQFREAQKMFKTIQKSGGRGLSRLFG